MTIAGAGERRPGEGQEAFAAFARYRGMGSERSTARVAQEFGKSKRLIERWSSRWDWVRRAAEWDRVLDRARRETHLRAITEMAERHAKMAVAVQGRVITRLNQLDPAELSPSDLIRWFEISVKIERLSRGEPTESTQLVGADDSTNRPCERNLAILTDPVARPLALALYERLQGIELPASPGT